jgi:predicted dehydrogenase
MKKIPVAIVGLKHGMASVLEVLSQPHFELVAVCSKTRDSYEYLCGKKMPTHLESVTFTEPREILIEKCRRVKDFSTVEFYGDYDRLLESRDIEAVIIAVPIALNAEFPLRALKKNKHVLASKPFALTLQQGLELKETAIRAGKKFMVCFQFRYSPLMRSIKDQLDRGAIGKLQVIWWNMFRMPFRGVYSRKELSGGPFIAENCHWFDLFGFFNAEERFRKVCAFGGLDVLKDRQEIEDNAVCIVEYENAVRASLNFTYFTDQPEHVQFGLVGDQGKITATTEKAGSYILYNGKEKNRTEFIVNPLLAHQGHLGFDEAHRLFAEVILKDLDGNEAEASRGFENFLVTLAAQMSLDRGKIIGRDEVLSSG